MNNGEDDLIKANADAKITHHLHKIKGLLWLNQWFDNVMDNLPELAICYRQKSLTLPILSLPIGHHWLSKSSGADTIHQFEIFAVLKNEFGPLSLVVRSCAHEQFARLILKNEDLDFVFQPEGIGESVHVNFSVEEFVEDMSIPCMEFVREGHVGRGLAPQLRTDLFSAELAAVHHLYDGINSLIQTRRILSDDGEWRSDEERVLRLLLLQTSKLDRKFWSLSLLLAETYLCLGDAYKESGQLRQALCTVELACNVYGSMPIKFEDACFVSAFVLNEPELPAGDLGHQNKHLFWGKAWCLVGEIYTKLHRLLGKSEEEPAFSPIRMPCEIKEVVERVKNFLLARTKSCASCSLLNCICTPQTSKKHKHKRRLIFSYLKWTELPQKEETILQAALDCFEEAQRALLIFPSACKIAIRGKGWVQTSIGLHMLSSKVPEKAEKAFADAGECFMEAEDFEGIVSINLNRGSSRLAGAEQKFAMLGGMGINRSKAYKKACVLAVKDYICVLQYYLVAKTESTSASRTLKIETYKKLGDAYLRLGHHLSKCDVIAEAAREMKSFTDSGRVKLTVEDCMKEAANLYKAVNLKSDAGGAYLEFANHYKKKFLESTNLERAREHCLLADRYWNKSFEVFGPENNPKVFLFIMNEAADLTFMLAERFNNKLGSETLETLLCRCFEAQHISESDEVSLENQLSGFWLLFQKILTRFLLLYKSSVDPETKLVVEKLKSFYRKVIDEKKRLSDLKAMHLSWTSEASQSEIIRTSDGINQDNKGT